MLSQFYYCVLHCILFCVLILIIRFVFVAAVVQSEREGGAVVDRGRREVRCVVACGLFVV